MKRAIAVSILCFLGLLIGGLNATASGPTRVSAAVPDPLFFDCPGFELMANFPANQEYALIFTYADGSTRVIITGRLVVIWTNMSDPSKTMTANVSGPAVQTFNADGSAVLMMTGMSSNGTNLVSGRVLIAIDPDGNATFSTTGRVKADVCAALT